MFDVGAIVFTIRAAGAAIFRQDMTEAEKAAERLGRTSETASQKTEELGKKQETAAQTARRLAKEQADAEKAAREYADAQDAVGKALVGAGAAIVATTALSVNAAIDWESAWAGVTKTVDENTDVIGGSYAEIEAGLRDLTAVLPASHAEIAAVAEAAGQLGVKTQDIVGFTQTMIDLGETTNLSSDQAATSLAQLMNIMGTAGEDVDRLGSTIVALGNDGASTEAEIVSMAQRIAGSGKLVGATEGEVLALANALASMGVTAELGGGVASRILQDLYSAVETGGEKLDGFASVAGVSAQQFATAFRNDPVRAMGEFATGLNGVEASGGNVVQTLSDLGFKSTEEQRILLQLKSAGDLLTDSLELQNTAWEENTALQNEAAKRYETVEAQIGIMRNRVNEAAIDLGSVFLPVVADVVGGLADFASGIAALPAPLQEAIAIGGLMVGVVALVGGTAMIAVPKVAALWGQIQLLTATGTRANTAMGRLGSFLGGPWGVALVAATALMVAYNRVMEEGIPAQEEVTNSILGTASATDKLGGAIQKNKFVPQIDENTLGLLKDLPSLLDQSAEASDNWFVGLMKSSTASDEAFETLKRYGDSLGELAGTNMPAASAGFRQLVDEFDLTDEQALQLLDTMPGLRDALLQQANDAGEAADEQSLLNTLLEEAEAPAKTAAEAYVEAADSAADLRDELDQLLALLNESNELGQDAISANLDYKDALAAVDEQIQKARDGVEGYSLGLADNTQAGRDNMGLLVGIAEKAWSVVEADLAHGASIEEVQQKLNDSRDALIQRALDFGYSADEAVALADEILRIPTSAEWTMYTHTEQAKSELGLLWSSLDRLVSQTWDIPVQTTVVGAGTVLAPGFGSADGNVVTYHANGSVSENHVAQIARAGDYRVWAEDETGGESYVPHHPSKRARSDAIMVETARILGGTYIPAGGRGFAEGAALSPVAAPAEPVRVIVSASGELMRFIEVAVQQPTQALGRSLKGVK